MSARAPAARTAWTEAQVIRAIARQPLASRCVVLVPQCSWTGYECDVLAVTTDLRVVDIEVKVSRQDFRVDAKKDKWWHRQFGHYDPETQRYVDPTPIHRTWPPKVWKHYYAIPRAIWSDDLFPLAASPASGVLLLHELNPERPAAVPRIDVVRRAKPDRDASRLTPAQAIDIARLANLRMWDALATQQPMETAA